MNNRLIAYLPMVTFPHPIPEDSVTRSVKVASALGAALHAVAFKVVIPRVSSALGDLLINIPEMIRAAEDHSDQHCQSLAERARRDASQLDVPLECSQVSISPTEVSNCAATEARYFDLSILGLAKDIVAMRDVAEAVIFGSGRPSILVPEDGPIEAVDHIAIAWDGSLVAARALSDARFLVGEGIHFTVITVAGEKPLGDQELAKRLAASLERRGLEATALTLKMAGTSVGMALQQAAIDVGARLLVMGAYGHSRLREFVLGGATRDVLNDLRLPVLLSH